MSFSYGFHLIIFFSISILSPFVSLLQYTQCLIFKQTSLMFESFVCLFFLISFLFYSPHHPQSPFTLSCAFFLLFVHFFLHLLLACIHAPIPYQSPCHCALPPIIPSSFLDSFLVDIIIRCKDIRNHVDMLSALTYKINLKKCLNIQLPTIYHIDKHRHTV